MSKQGVPVSGTGGQAIANGVEIKRDKGKGKEEQHHRSSSISSALEEALSTPLPPPRSPEEYLEPSISRPPMAHHYNHTPSHLRPHTPRLLSQLTRSTLPSASLTYATSPTKFTQPSLYGESSSSSAAAVVYDEPFPDLDPTTGLPLEASRDSIDSDVPSLHLQRTITDLLHTPTKQPSTLPFGLSLPSLPSLAKSSSPTTVARRRFSTSSTQDDWGSWKTGWWGGNKGKVDRMMTEEDQADTVEEEQQKHRRKYRSPEHPLVFCHGLLGFDYLGPASLPPLQISHWRGIREVLDANGVDLLITRVPATASIKDRAVILAEAIEAKYKGRKVNLIGHSMGGLDCRYLISELRPTTFEVISLTTVATPHRGSPFADYFIDNFIGRERLPALLALLESFRLPQSGDGTAFEALGTKAMKEFNSLVVDSPDVKYYSWGASFEPGLFDAFRWSHSIILAKEGPNDGLVSVQSAKWGEYRGTLLDVSHPDLVGWINQVRYTMAAWAGRPITFKPATFYLEVADYLAEQGL